MTDSTRIGRRAFLQSTGATAAAISLSLAGCASRRRLPNIIIIYTDDQGYSDVGVYGAKGFTTPNLDQIAAEGMRFTNFYVTQAVCSASRAGLLTGCLPNRIGIQGALGPNSKHGISENEMTLAELVKQRNYATAIFGKWHLGHLPPFLPMRHGFDEYFGLPYSNDMWPRHPENPTAYTDLPLMDQDQIVEYNPDMDMLTTRYTERAVQFIDKNKAHPFFLYLAHSMPHVPLGVSNKFRGKSQQGMYGDVIMEIDWSVGQILKAIARHNLQQNTLLMFASDNGPWLSYGDHAGTASPLREGKGTTWEGGVRVPFIVSWPGKIPEGQICHEPAMTIDILPTVAHLIDAQLPLHPIDGKNIWPLISGKSDAKSPHETFYFYYGDELQALRSGQWKLHFAHPYRTLQGRPGSTGGIPVKYDQDETGIALYDLSNDPGEQRNVAEQFPDVVQRLASLGQQFDEHLKSQKRQPGRI